MALENRVVSLTARRGRDDAALDQWLLAELREAKALGKPAGVPRSQLVFAERKRN